MKKVLIAGVVLAQSIMAATVVKHSSQYARSNCGTTQVTFPGLNLINEDVYSYGLNDEYGVSVDATLSCAGQVSCSVSEMSSEMTKEADGDIVISTTVCTFNKYVSGVYLSATAQLSYDMISENHNYGTGDVTFTLATNEQKEVVEVFARKNGEQNVAKDIVRGYVQSNVESTSIIAAHGIYVYKLTVPQDGYVNGSEITARFYTAKNGIQEFYPGPTPADWSDVFYWKTPCPVRHCGAN